MSTFYISDGMICDDVVVLIVGGEIDYEASPQLRERIMGQLKADGRRLVLDLSWATFIDSTAIGVLTGAVVGLREASGGSLAIVCTHEKILQVFEITGLADMVGLYRSRDEALTALAMAG
ncbi:MAG TPA: STAS domain-containing protein [Solirubrobacteraceae bacterium]|jgi:anti-sigma B factor antagonist|nr:STAS domain-containing protein [Solirubrobacteraceae bacterium]